MTTKTPIAFLISGALALGVVACGDDEDEAGGGGGGEPVAQVDKLTGVSTSVALDAAFVEALTTLKVTPGPVGDAKITKAGEAVFPITGGNVTYYEPGTESPSVQGIINHEGSGLSLEAGGTLVELENFDVDPGASVLTGDVSVDGKVAAKDAELFFLDGRTLNPLEVDKKSNTATLQGTTVKLKQSAAELLNKTFKIDALAGDFVIGTATITINAS
ncbi:MAG: hypothetical protein WKF94_16005 [Solirubrobacteraceae bacterium]